MHRDFFRLSIILVAVLFSKGALATPDFADVLKARFNIPTDASQMCTLCHETLIGGPKTAKQPFGVTLNIKHGLTKFDSAGLVRILTEMEASGEDSDGDLVGDIAELKAGTDPNVNDITGEAAEQTRYGCYCSTPRAGAPLSTPEGPCLTVLLLCAWRVRRSSAQRARSAYGGSQPKPTDHTTRNAS